MKKISHAVVALLGLSLATACGGQDETDLGPEEDRAEEDVVSSKILFPVFDRSGTAQLAAVLNFSTACVDDSYFNPIGIAGTLTLRYSTTRTGQSRSVSLERLDIGGLVRGPTGVTGPKVTGIALEAGGVNWQKGVTNGPHSNIDLGDAPTIPWTDLNVAVVDVVLDSGIDDIPTYCTARVTFEMEPPDRSVEQVVVSNDGLRARTIPVLDMVDGILYSQATPWRSTIDSPVPTNRVGGISSVLTHGTSGETLYEWIADTHGSIQERRSSLANDWNSGWGPTGSFNDLPGGLSNITAISSSLFGTELVVAIWKGETGYRRTYPRDAGQPDGVRWTAGSSWSKLEAGPLPNGGDPQAGGGLITQQGFIIDTSPFTWNTVKCGQLTSYGTYLQAWWRKGSGSQRGYRRVVPVDGSGNPLFTCAGDTSYQGGGPSGLRGQSMHPLDTF